MATRRREVCAVVARVGFLLVAEVDGDEEVSDTEVSPNAPVLFIFVSVDDVDRNRIGAVVSRSGEPLLAALQHQLGVPLANGNRRSAERPAQGRTAFIVLPR